MLRYSAHLIIISAMVVASFAFSLFSAAPYQDLLDCTDSRECHLYSIIRPSEYDVSLKLFIPSDAANISRGEELTFDGVVSVKFNTTEKTTKLSFHASNLKFKSVKISCGEALPPTDAVYTVHSSSVTMHLAKELAAGSWCSIMFHYTGSMSDHIRGGLVKESISLTEGREKWIVFTGYKLFTAMPRTLFPCIDEPSYRANFLLELIHPSEMVAIASTPLRETMKTEYGWTYSIFEKTDKIPTYGVSFAVGHFKKIASQTTPKRTINTWIPYDIESTTLLDSTSTVVYIEQLESYLDVDYPSSKLDIVGLPQYYDRDFMCSSFRTPTSGIVFVAHDSTDSFAMVKKALARGWFGILTSPGLWNDGFLSEGFATYIYTLGEHLSLNGKAEDMVRYHFTLTVLFF
ncbi:hypothetical protein AB6A40_000515 [Gnathostoma spinigerum]|uniref:Uncharacterized protein n=1 Tax=Gnathostoma spinigerum TaxID=75299 RepID=A0ABD6E3G9_9BILA